VPRLDQHQYSSAIHEIILLHQYSSAIHEIILFHQYSYAIQINIFLNVIQLDNSWSASDPDPAPGFAIALEANILNFIFPFVNLDYFYLIIYVKKILKRINVDKKTNIF